MRESLGSLGQQQHLQILLGPRELLGQRRALGRGHLVELVARRQRFRQLAGAGELAAQAAELFELGDDRLEIGQGLLSVPNGPVILNELRVGQARLDLFVLAADFFESFEHGTEPSALSSRLTAGQSWIGAARAR